MQGNYFSEMAALRAKRKIEQLSSANGSTGNAGASVVAQNTPSFISEHAGNQTTPVGIQEGSGKLDTTTPAERKEPNKVETKPPAVIEDGKSEEPRTPYFNQFAFLTEDVQRFQKNSKTDGSVGVGTGAPSTRPPEPPLKTKEEEDALLAQEAPEEATKKVQISFSEKQFLTAVVAAVNQPPPNDFKQNDNANMAGRILTLSNKWNAWITEQTRLFNEKIVDERVKTKAAASLKTTALLLAEINEVKLFVKQVVYTGEGSKRQMDTKQAKEKKDRPEPPQASSA